VTVTSRSEISSFLIERGLRPAAVAMVVASAFVRFGSGWPARSLSTRRLVTCAMRAASSVE
jgi:hypothetical protein